MRFDPSSVQSVTPVPDTVLWNPTMPATSVHRCSQVQSAEAQLASGTSVPVAPGAPASVLLNL